MRVSALAKQRTKNLQGDGFVFGDGARWVLIMVAAAVVLNRYLHLSKKGYIFVGLAVILLLIIWFAGKDNEG